MKNLMLMVMVLGLVACGRAKDRPGSKTADGASSDTGTKKDTKDALKASGTSVGGLKRIDIMARLNSVVENIEEISIEDLRSDLSQIELSINDFVEGDTFRYEEKHFIGKSHGEGCQLDAINTLTFAKVDEENNEFLDTNKFSDIKENGDCEKYIAKIKKSASEKLDVDTLEERLRPALQIDEEKLKELMKEEDGLEKKIWFYRGEISGQAVHVLRLNGVFTEEDKSVVGQSEIEAFFVADFTRPVTIIYSEGHTFTQVTTQEKTYVEKNGVFSKLID